ncbi:MAG: hypothetical protein HON32_02885 [Francisellaceae bacterium]|jgi:hypothetical protein|nr:hypothetical protein [Francisellaceae bacterium]MBT6538270.1 hypothetical protein [Francisellaceae bacterium]
MASDEVDDDIDLGEDFDFDEDIPDEEVDYDESGGGGSKSQNSSGGGAKSVVKGFFVTVFGVGFIAVLGGGGYYGYNRYINKSVLPQSTTIAKIDTKDKKDKTSSNMNGFGDDVSSLVAGTDDLFNSYESSSKSKNTTIDFSSLPDKKADKVSVDELQDDIKMLSSKKGEALDLNIKELKETLNTIAVELSTNINHVQGLESIVKDMSRVVISLNKTIHTMDNRVLSLTQTVDGINTDFTDLKGDISSVQSNLSKVNRFVKEEDYDLTRGGSDNSSKIIYQAPEYVVHAIIPGRAWLKSTSGKIVTVTEGQSLGNYGSIAVIDTENGTVVTSSGTSFR